MAEVPNQDLEVARRLDETVESATLFVYLCDRHLFADDSVPDHDENAATLLKRRVLGFLDGVGSRRLGRRPSEPH